jgi:regulatory protein
MAGTVTALRFQKRDKNRVNVYLDGQFAFGLAAIEAARLRVGQALGDDDIARLQRQDKVERAHGRALNFLSYRPRSEAEVRRNLHKKGVQEEVVEVVIERLTRAGMLDDREFARYWVENRLQFNPRGARALGHELRQKGVPASIIADALVGFDEETAARKASEAGARRLAHLEPDAFRRRLGAYLARRGFSYVVIAPLVEEMLDAVHCEVLPDIEQISKVRDEDNG